MASMTTPLVSTAASLPQHLRVPTAAASFGAGAGGLTSAGLPAGLTALGPAQAAAYANAAAAAAGGLLDPYLGQSIGPIAGYQNALYRRFAPY